MIAKLLIVNLKLKIKYFIFCLKWSERNRHNYTTPKTIFDIDLVEVGRYSYGELNIVSFNSNTLLKIGSFCSIGQNVSFVLEAEHNINAISTYPFKTAILKSQKHEAFSKGNIIVDDDVWIGYGSTIMSGVHIGQGAIIAAGAVVTKDVPPYAIVGGVPAKVIKYRFEPEIIQQLLKVDYSKLNEDMIKEHINDLYEKVAKCNQLEWMPRK